jgi:broad specificity phosphatase PhoE
VLLVVRHGRTAANASGLLLGRADPELDELGRRQAAAIAAVLPPIDRVVASPLRRAQQTAAAFGLPIETDERWIELDFGEWDGRPLGVVPLEAWAQWRAVLDFGPPGGECLAALGRRVRAACDDLLEAAAHGNVVVVTHVSPVKAAVAWALGVSDDATWRMYVAPASISRVEVREGRTVLTSFDEVGHLPAP